MSPSTVIVHVTVAEDRYLILPQAGQTLISSHTADKKTSIPLTSMNSIPPGKRKPGEESGGSVVKKLKSEASLEHPAFYYSIHRHSIKGLNMPK